MPKGRAVSNWFLLQWLHRLNSQGLCRSAACAWYLCTSAADLSRGFASAWVRLQAWRRVSSVFSPYSQGGSLFSGTGCLNAVPREPASHSLGSHWGLLHHCHQEMQTRGRGKTNITCALAEGAAGRSSLVLIQKPKIRPLQSLLFVEAVILHRCLREYRTDHVQNNLIPDLDPFQSSCGQFSASGDLQQFWVSTSVVPVRDPKEQPGCVAVTGARERFGWEPAGTEVARAHSRPRRATPPQDRA